MRFLKASLPVFALMLAAVQPARAATVTVGFNAVSDLTNFNVNHDAAPSNNFNFGATAGVSDNGGQPGGGLTTNSTDTTANYKVNGFLLTDPSSISVMFNSANPASPTSDRFLQLGFG